jgi:predicted RNA polymerase sigma factor
LIASVSAPPASRPIEPPADATKLRIAGHHRFEAVRAHLLEMAGDRTGARERYRAAARGTTSLPERRYLDERAARLT